MTAETAGLIQDASCVPDDLIPPNKLAFRRFRTEELRKAAFLDGRENLGQPAGSVSFAAIATNLHCSPSVKLPTLLHVSFCGSTLLARIIDIPKATVVYREPAIQIALADRCAAGVDIARELALVTSLLARPVHGQVAIVKPTNWANILLPIWAEAKSIRPVFITMEPRRFLTAVFRGGRDRIAFTMRTADHFASVVPGGAMLVASAASADVEPLAKAARITLVTLALQLRLFDYARLRLGGEVINELEIRADPLAAARRSMQAFGLAELVERTTFAETLSQHAKAPGRTFSSTAEADANAAIEEHHGEIFDDALAWAARAGVMTTLSG